VDVGDGVTAFPRGNALLLLGDSDSAPRLAQSRIGTIVMLPRQVVRVLVERRLCLWLSGRLAAAGLTIAAGRWRERPGPTFRG
jgi:hypothetical protein